MLDNDEKLYDKLIDAIDKGDEKKVQEAIDEGVYVNKLNKDLKTPLVISIEKGNYKIAKLLLNNNAQVDLPVMPDEDYKMHTALYSAVLNGETKENYEFIKELIQRGVNLNVDANDITYPDDDIQYRLPLKLAIEKNYNNIAKLLIENGAKYNFVNINECSEEIKEAINKKEKEKENYRQGIIDELREDINSDTKLKNQFSSDNIDKVAEFYVDRKMGVNVNLAELNSNELDDLLMLNNYRKEKNRLKRVEKNSDERKEITNQEIEEFIKKDIPVYIRAVSSAVGIEHGYEDTEIGQNRNKTGIELEIDKLIREENEETNTRMKGQKTGNPARSVTMINYGKAGPFRDVGYGSTDDKLEDIYVASSIDINTQYSKRRNGLVMNVGRVNEYNMPIEKQITDVLEKLKVQKHVDSHNELVMDISSKNVKFIFWSDTNNNLDSKNLAKLKAVYFRKKFYEQTGRELPIFQYDPGNKDYLKETNFTKEEVINMLKDELIEEIGNGSNKTYKLKSPYNNESSLNFLITFKDEIDNIVIDGHKDVSKKVIQTVLNEFLEEKVNFYSKEENIGNIHNVVNLIKFAGMVKGSEYQGKVFCDIFKNVDLNKNIINFLKRSSTGYNDSINYFAERRENRMIDFAIEIMSDIKSLATTNEASEIFEEKLKIIKENMSDQIFFDDEIKKMKKFYIISDEKSRKILELCSKNSDFKEILFKTLTRITFGLYNLERLVEQGMNIHEVDKNGKSILEYAKENNAKKIEKYLIENEININAKNSVGSDTMLSESVSNERKSSISSDITITNDKSTGSGINVKSIISEVKKIEQESKKINEYLLDNGIKINSKNSIGSNTTLSESVSNERKSSISSDITLVNDEEIRTGVNVKSMISKFENMAQKSKELEDKLKKVRIDRNNHKLNNKVDKNITMD